MWIFVITDGEDNKSKLSFSRLKKELENQEANLLILGLTLNGDYVDKLKELCNSTKEGTTI
jgi:hypothetical protein